MALQMAFTTRGVASPDGYWKLVQSDFDHLNKTGRVTFAGYHTKAAREADALNNILTTHGCDVSPELYAQFIGEPADIRGQCYGLAKAAKEGPPPLDGRPDARVSFFAEAADC